MLDPDPPPAQPERAPRLHPLRCLDTEAEASEAQFAVWARLGAERRSELAASMSDDARCMAREGIRARHPEYTEAEAELALRRMLLGDALFRPAWPQAPLLAP